MPSPANQPTDPECLKRVMALAKNDKPNGEALAAAMDGKHEWQSLFHIYEDFVNCAPLRFAITGFLQEDAITMLAGASGDQATARRC